MAMVSGIIGAHHDVVVFEIKLHGIVRCCASVGGIRKMLPMSMLNGCDHTDGHDVSGFVHDRLKLYVTLGIGIRCNGGGAG